MTIRQEDGLIRLEGLCRVEEAETLTRLLLGQTGAVVEISSCEGMHAAVAQALLAFRPRIAGTPANAFVRDHLVPALSGRAGDGAAGPHVSNVPA